MQSHAKILASKGLYPTSFFGLYLADYVASFKVEMPNSKLMKVFERMLQNCDVIVIHYQYHFSDSLVGNLCSRAKKGGRTSGFLSVTKMTKNCNLTFFSAAV